MTETDAARILSDLAARYSSAPYDPAQDVTLRDIIAALGCGESAARNYADKEVRAGRLTVRLVTIGVARCNVYRRSESAS